MCIVNNDFNCFRKFVANLNFVIKKMQLLNKYATKLYE